MTRDMMIDEVIRHLGFENKYTIWFCELAEDATISDDSLFDAMMCAICLGKEEED